MKLIEQLKNPKVWQVIIGLLTGVGLIEFTDSQALQVAGALALVVTNLALAGNAVLSQKGDNDTNVEMARTINRDVMAREVSLNQPRSVLVDVDVAEQLTRMKNEIYGLRSRILELEGRRAAGNPNRVVSPETWDRQAVG